MERQTIEVNISINKSVSQVFDYLTNFRNLAPTEVSVLDVAANGPVEVGTKFKIKGSLNNGNWESDNEIISLDEDKTLGYTRINAIPLFNVTYIFNLEKSLLGTKLTLITQTVTSNIDITRKHLEYTVTEIKKRIKK